MPLSLSTLYLLSPLLFSTLQPIVGQNTLSSLTSSFGLTSASYNFTAPASTLNSDDAQSWIRSNWDLAGRISFGGNDIVFSPDPSTSTSTLVRRESSASTHHTSMSTKTSKSSSSISSSSSSTSTSTTSTIGSLTSPASTALAGRPPVLRIEYPAGSYSKATGGTQFYLAPLNSTGGYERMLLSYDIWFPEGFDWNQGGKLPGLRGGPDSRGCSGGKETDGTGCFSTRIMWRTNGAGEVYAYVPTSQPGFCTESGITCNPDYGTSLARGSFSFVTGQWQTIWLMVILNELGTANGVVELYYNGVSAVSFQNLELRSSSSISSVGGLFFSTFFGGDDSSWATPTTQHTYYRNMVLYAGEGAANGTGAAISSAGRTARSLGGVGVLGAMVLFGLGWVS